MKALLIAQGHSPSTDNIITAFKERGHDLTVMRYWENGEQSAEIVDGKFVYKDTTIDPAAFDAAMLRSWGTAPLGAEFLKACEMEGVTTLNPTPRTAVTNSKVESAELFMLNDISFPETLTYDKRIHKKKNNTQANAKINFMCAEREIGPPPYVFKTDYGCRGMGVRFISTIKELNEALDETRGAIKPGWLLQEFIGNAGQPISHYRVLVSEDKAFAQSILFTANSPLTPSNGSKGAKSEFIKTPDDIHDLAVKATKTTGLNFASVDIMRREDGTPVILEVNDSPATDRFDVKGLKASEAAVIALENQYQEEYGLDIAS